MFVPLIALLISQIHAQIIEPNPCGVNAQFTWSCRVGCATCAKPNRYCIRLIPRPRCSCLPGYVINTAANDTCVFVNSLECRAQRFYTYVQLPPTCGPNEQFVYCGVCGATCDNPGICGRCVCADGYLRDSYGNCILANSLCCILENPSTLSPLTLGPLDPVTGISKFSNKKIKESYIIIN